jgi:cysteine synthase A
MTRLISGNLVTSVGAAASLLIAVSFFGGEQIKRFWTSGNSNWHDGEDEEQENTSESAYLSLVGNTPLVELKKLSALTGCRFLVKMESMNPGGTGKDRAVRRMLRVAAERAGPGGLPPGSTVVEGTSGSTGISLACACNALGLRLHVVIPDDQADEKKRLLESLGASVTITPCCAISNEGHYVNTARRIARGMDCVFIDQFENTANFFAHLEETGPELWEQTGGNIDAFVMSAGTGGTIAGVSQCLKARDPRISVVLADPPGSSLLHKVTHGVCFAPQQAEKKLRRHRYDSLVEGVGLDRVTANFERASIDTAVRVSDQDTLEMAHWLLREEGLFVGSSSALNIAAACRVAEQLQQDNPGAHTPTIVTVVCDNGRMHLSRFWNPSYVGNYGLSWPGFDVVPACLHWAQETEIIFSPNEFDEAETEAAGRRPPERAAEEDLEWDPSQAFVVPKYSPTPLRGLGSPVALDPHSAVLLTGLSTPISGRAVHSSALSGSSRGADAFSSFLSSSTASLVSGTSARSFANSTSPPERPQKGCSRRPMRRVTHLQVQRESLRGWSPAAKAKQRPGSPVLNDTSHSALRSQPSRDPGQAESSAVDEGVFEDVEARLDALETRIGDMLSAPTQSPNVEIRFTRSPIKNSRLSTQSKLPRAVDASESPTIMTPQRPSPTKRQVPSLESRHSMEDAAMDQSPSRVDKRLYVEY